MTIAKRSFTICIAESASGKDEANPAFWLATQAAKMGPFCPLGISRDGPVRKSSLFGHTKNPLLTTGKLVRSRRLYIGFVFFFAFLLTSKFGGGGVVGGACLSPPPPPPPPPPPACLYPHHTNVCKMSRLWWAIPSLVFNKSLSN